MGCGSSVSHLASAGADPTALQTTTVWCDPAGKPLKQWSAQDVETWYLSLPIRGLQAKKDVVLGGMTGAFVADKWSEQMLGDAGLTVLQSAQLIAFRDTAAATSGTTVNMSTSVLTQPLASAVESRPAESPAAATAPSKTITYLKVGIGGLRLLLDKAGPLLPIPGAAGVLSGLSSLLGMVETTMETSDNVAALRDRSFDLLEVVMANSAALCNTEKDKAVRLMSNFNDVLMEIIVYATEYTGRNWLMKVITSGGDSTHYTELLSRLQELVADATLGIAADIRTQVAAVLLRLDEPLAFVDQGGPARDLILQYGGIEAVVLDTVKISEVMQLLDPGQHLNAILVQQAMAIVVAASEEGVHRLIKQADMCVFWRKNFKMLPAVEWKLFWAAFPSELADNPMSAEQVGLIQGAVRSKAAQAQFRKHVSATDTVGVADIKLTFLAHADLLATVQRLASNVAQATGGGGGTTFRLQQPDPLYSGREDDALDIVERLQTGKHVVCLVADAGMGKSSLALDAGARMWADGLIPGGARFVDMREAGSKEGILGRFCAALEVQEDGDVDSAILTKLRLLIEEDAPVLLVVDNAEDALSCEEEVQQAFRELLSKIANLGQESIRLLVTSRAELDLRGAAMVVNIDVSQLGKAAAVRLVKRIAIGLSDGEAATVAALSCCVPLLLRLVASALAAGRIIMQELQVHLPTPSSDLAAAGLVETTVNTMLVALPRQQQLALIQLSVFASGFDNEGAAAVMGVEAYRARGIIQVLNTHGLLMFDTAKHQWLLHMAVKTTARQLPLSTLVLPSAQTAFVEYILRLLNLWSGMHSKGGANMQLALQLARDQQADTLAAFSHLATTTASAPLVASACTASGFCNEGLAMYNSATYISAWGNMVGSTAASAPDSQQHATAQTCYAESLRFHGECEQAEPLYRQALDTRTRLLGLEHPDTAESIHDLAVCAKDQGKYAEAEALHRQALDIRRRLLGPEHTDTVTSIQNLAVCIKNLGKYAEAEPMYRTAHEIFTRLVGAEHPDAITSLSNLAVCLAAMKRNAEAEVLYRQLLEMRTRLLGAEHPYTISLMNSLAVCLKDQGRYSEAEPVYREALELRTRVLGPAHPHSINSINNLAVCYATQGKQAEAEPMYRQALEVLGANHSNAVNSIGNLAMCLAAQGKDAEAEPLFVKALGLRIAQLGTEHTHSLGCACELAKCVLAQGKHTEAEPLFRRALEVCSRVLGVKHPQSAACAAGLAACTAALAEQ